MRLVGNHRVLLGAVFAAAMVGGALKPAVASQITTTLYVDRHFEVRDHDEPVKYVFNGETRVARSTGSLKPTPRLQRFRIHPGWNLLSLAVSATNALYQITNRLPAVPSSPPVLRWDLTVPGWKPLLPGGNLPPDTILSLKAVSGASLIVVGNYQEPAPRSVEVTGSFVPGAGLRAWDFKNAVSNVPSASAWTYDSSVAGWLIGLAAPLQSQSDLQAFLPPGSAAFVRAGAPAQLAVPDAASRIRYYHQDHLGSSSVMTDSAGAIVEENNLLPSGSVRAHFQSQQIREPYLFTDKERDAETRLDYFGARFLSSICQHFCSVDPVALRDLDDEHPSAGQRFQNPQRLNPYAYAMGNPLRYVDLQGEDITTPLTGRKVETQKNHSAVVTLKNTVQVTILPDRTVGRLEHSAPGALAETTINVRFHGSKKTGTFTASFSIQTSYLRGVTPSHQEGAGRGTTDEDVKNGNTSVGFHEGHHGDDLLTFMEENPPPTFNPDNLKFDRSFTYDKAKQQFMKELKAYATQANEYTKQQTDCVGTPEADCK